MKYYEITNMDDPRVSDLKQTRVIDEDELNRRLLEIIEADYNLDEAKDILLHGKVKEVPDPWEEWAENTAHDIYDATESDIKAALLKLKKLVGKEN